MNTKTKAPEGANNVQNLGNKDTKDFDNDQTFQEKNFSASGNFKTQVLTLLKSGNYTAKELNEKIGNNFNDSRKSISLLRRDGYNIGDYRINSRGTKKYYYVSDNQPTLFGEGVYYGL